MAVTIRTNLWGKISSLALVVLFYLCFIQTVLADCPSADLTGDCFVDFEDFALMANLWLFGDPNIPEGMVYIPYGGFEMGDHFAEGGSSDDELPLHPVLIDAFFMSKYAVTNQQYCNYLNSAFGTGIYVSSGIVYGTGNNQLYCRTSTNTLLSQIACTAGVFSVRTKGGRDMANDPMVVVSWYGAVAYCNWRSNEEGYESCYNLSTWDCNFSQHGYRLPTEAEWEYAARGGNPDYRFPWGNTISHSQANYYAAGGEAYDLSYPNLYHPVWYDGVYPYTAPVGSFSANGYGLYDMAGNVWDWCNDWWASNYYDTSPYDNPTGPANGTYRIFRGGGYHDLACLCRVSLRNHDRPDYMHSGGGFRLVLDLD